MTADRAPFAGTVPTDPLPSMGEVWSASDRLSLERLNWRPEGGGVNGSRIKFFPKEMTSPTSQTPLGQITSLTQLPKLAKTT
jgi:hypothetical protein